MEHPWKLQLLVRALREESVPGLSTTTCAILSMDLDIPWKFLLGGEHLSQGTNPRRRQKQVVSSVIIDWQTYLVDVAKETRAVAIPENGVVKATLSNR
ncbi:hypothetical protein C5167_028288 [Papaver somniferum]|nr:hypothetical protein C5167_028288 [Papaver somniferum]